MGSLHALADGMDVAVFHPYLYGVLDELLDTFALRDTSRPFPQERARRELLREDAPEPAEWAPPEADRWRTEATVVGPREVYVHDWCDARAWDALAVRALRHPPPGMEQKLTDWIAAAADGRRDAEESARLRRGLDRLHPAARHVRGGAGRRGLVPARRGEAARRSLGRGRVLQRGPSPPMWQDVALQRECNALLRG
ncbi:hypothetical protein [Streptomyces sp. SS52]|uniref:hypothetical protein n=1 Tax=Streptomyces sp. SS52 TaxID=2563602 RepID=UPI001FF819C2|nr:hypothetical protein [Streptomyces sp. SS52]